VVEGARLESVFRGNSNVGSNPTLSASKWAEKQRLDARLVEAADFQKNITFASVLLTFAGDSFSYAEVS
jgi:hypothetical protein